MKAPGASQVTGVILADRKPRILNEKEIAEGIDTPVDSGLWDGSLATIMTLPLYVYGETLGTLTLATAKPDGYDTEDMRVGTTIATHLALAIERWQQTDRVQEVNQELTRLASFPEMNPRPIIELSPDGRIHYLNPAGEELFPDCRYIKDQVVVARFLPKLLAGNLDIAGIDFHGILDFQFLNGDIFYMGNKFYCR